MSDTSIIEGGKPFFLEGNEVGVLLSHGFTGTASCMKPLGEYLNRTEGWSVLGVRLKGHGETPAAMAQTTAQDWIDSVEAGLQELEKRCKQVFMAGLSMGGTLTLYMAGRYPERFKAIAPINACVAFSNPDLAALAFDHKAPATVPGVGSDIKKPGVKEIVYADVPVPAIKQIYGLMAVTRDLLPRITAPTQVLVSPDDHIVPARNATHILSGIHSQVREQVLLPESYHVATLDNDAELIHRSVQRFFKQALAD
ncbi:alpha/beta hydrolase [Comamonas composti]|uniref:alpha/beta hydrolase n=1 Tax=Comamonas composti TaxID=408558 RepID=UPI0003F92C5E|nr:alpha/beta fold hydrolase [Comamonas composti]